VDEKEKKWDSYQTLTEYPCMVSQKAFGETMNSTLSCKEHCSFFSDLK